jgi:hypothetical protein
MGPAALAFHKIARFITLTRIIIYNGVDKRFFEIAVRGTKG